METILKSILAVSVTGTAAVLPTALSDGLVAESWVSADAMRICVACEPETAAALGAMVRAFVYGVTAAVVWFSFGVLTEKTEAYAGALAGLPASTPASSARPQRRTERASTLRIAAGLLLGTVTTNPFKPKVIDLRTGKVRSKN